MKKKGYFRFLEKKGSTFLSKQNTRMQIRKNYPNQTDKQETLVMEIMPELRTDTLNKTPTPNV